MAKKATKKKVSPASPKKVAKKKKAATPKKVKRPVEGWDLAGRGAVDAMV